MQLMLCAQFNLPSQIWGLDNVRPTSKEGVGSHVHVTVISVPMLVRLKASKTQNYNYMNKTRKMTEMKLDIYLR